VVDWHDPLPVFGDLATLKSRMAHQPRYKEAHV